jgi:hypothetical protein
MSLWHGIRYLNRYTLNTYRFFQLCNCCFHCIFNLSKRNSQTPVNSINDYQPSNYGVDLKPLGSVIRIGPIFTGGESFDFNIRDYHWTSHSTPTMPTIDWIQKIVNWSSDQERATLRSNGELSNLTTGRAKKSICKIWGFHGGDYEE